MKVYIIYTGYALSNSNYTVMGDTMATVAEPHAPNRLMHTPSYACLIEHPKEGWIMYDTGTTDNLSMLDGYKTICSQAKIVKPLGSSIPEQLSALGLKPEDIGYVITSHMHFDHIGNDRYFAKTADFYVSKEDAEFSYRNVLKSPDPEAYGWYIKEDVLLERKSVTYIEEDEELFDGIEVVTLPGHTPCVLGLVVHLESRTIIFPSDAVSEHRNYEGSLPGGCYDSLGYMKSLKKIKKLQRKYGAEVFFSHDVEQFGRMKKLPNYYV